MIIFLIFLSLNGVSYIQSFPDQGQWSRTYIKQSHIIFGMHKSLYAGSTVSISVNCDALAATNINISWLLRQTSCFEEYLGPEVLVEENLKIYFECPIPYLSIAKIRYLQRSENISDCSSRIQFKFENESFKSFDRDSPQTQDKLPRGCMSYRNELLREQNTANEEASLKKHDNEVESHKKDDVGNKVRKRSVVPERKDAPANAKIEPVIAKVDNSLNDPQASKPSTNPAKPVSEKNAESIAKKESVNNQLTTTTQKANMIPVPKTPVGTVKGQPVTVVDMDGVYLFIISIESVKNTPFNVTVDVSMKGDYGYLSAVDWPLLPFYGFMCGIYVIYAFAWLIVSALQWRDLLRIQFWIGGVILLGLMEKAVFYAEYQSINSTGQSVQGAVLFAEILSCMKRTLARMLVIIVSLGFGIVKPRLGPMLHRVVGVGGLYFILGTVEGCLRVLKPKNDPSNQALMAGIPLAVTDSAICWWIFSSLVQTIRTLRLRRNVVKLSLYRHFTNTLIFAVVASVAYMIWSIHSHKLVSCITDWKELWVDEAYWHLLFSVVLLVIMILWRPTNNNQRYAFTPLLDAADDDDEDDDLDMNPPNDAFAGMKMRNAKTTPNMSPKQNDTKSKQEDDLKWVEENIPSSLTEAALPSLLDSDEEIMTAKFERSKME